MHPTHSMSTGSGEGSRVDHVDPVRFQSIVDLFEDMPGGFADCIVGPFLSLLDLQVPSLKEALGLGDADALRRTAHTLKGGGRDLGFTRFGHLAEQIERDGRAGRMPDSQVTHAFMQEMDWVRAYLANHRP